MSQACQEICIVSFIVYVYPKKIVLNNCDFWCVSILTSALAQKFCGVTGAKAQRHLVRKQDKSPYHLPIVLVQSQKPLKIYTLCKLIHFNLQCKCKEICQNLPLKLLLMVLLLGCYNEIK